MILKKISFSFIFIFFYLLLSCKNQNSDLKILTAQNEVEFFVDFNNSVKNKFYIILESNNDTIFNGYFVKRNNSTEVYCFTNDGKLHQITTIVNNKKHGKEVYFDYISEPTIRSLVCWYIAWLTTD